MLALYALLPAVHHAGHQAGLCDCAAIGHDHATPDETVSQSAKEPASPESGSPIPAPRPSSPDGPDCPFCLTLAIAGAVIADTGPEPPAAALPVCGVEQAPMTAPWTRRAITDAPARAPPVARPERGVSRG